MLRGPSNNTLHLTVAPLACASVAPAGERDRNAHTNCGALVKFKTISSWVALMVALSPAIGVEPPAKSTRRAIADVEDALARSADPGTAWLTLAQSVERDGERVPALLCYIRFLATTQDGEASKEPAVFVWDQLVPPRIGKPPTVVVGTEAMKNPWFAADFLLTLLQSAWKSEATQEVPPTEYFALALDGFVSSLEDVANERKLKPFWRMAVISFFLQAQANGHIQSMAYDVTRSLGRPETLQWLESHKDEVTRYKDWVRQWRPGA